MKKLRDSKNHVRCLCLLYSKKAISGQMSIILVAYTGCLILFLVPYCIPHKFLIPYVFKQLLAQQQKYKNKKIHILNSISVVRYRRQDQKSESPNLQLNALIITAKQLSTYFTAVLNISLLLLTPFIFLKITQTIFHLCSFSQILNLKSKRILGKYQFQQLIYIHMVHAYTYRVACLQLSYKYCAK